MKPKLWMSDKPTEQINKQTNKQRLTKSVPWLSVFFSVLSCLYSFGTYHLKSLHYSLLLVSLCIVFCLCVCLYTMCIPGTCRGQKRMLKSLKLELQTFVCSHIVSGNWTLCSGWAANTLSSEPSLQPQSNVVFIKYDFWCLCEDILFIPYMWTSR